MTITASKNKTETLARAVKLAQHNITASIKKDSNNYWRLIIDESDYAKAAKVLNIFDSRENPSRKGRKNPNISGGETAWAQNATLSELRYMLDNFKYAIKHPLKGAMGPDRMWELKRNKAIVTKEIARRERNLPKRNPLSTISSGSADGWQAAHAFRQLPDGRVQILTNPRGKVPSKIKIVKRNRVK
jgi:hypothetical protein